MMIMTCSFKSITRASGIYDIIIMLPFVFPGVVAWTMLQLKELHIALLLPGIMPDFSPLHLFFINLMALITIVWSVLRVRNPLPLYALYDTVARVLIAMTMLVYLLHYQVSGFLWLFVVSELAWAAVQTNGYLFKYKYRHYAASAA